MIRKIGPAVSGQGGHNKTFEAACCLVKGFDLEPTQAIQWMTEWNKTCQPPWDYSDLWKKVTDANEEPDPEPRGYILRQQSDTHREQGGKRDRPEPTIGMAPEGGFIFDGEGDAQSASLNATFNNVAKEVAQ